VKHNIVVGSQAGDSTLAMCHTGAGVMPMPIGGLEMCIVVVVIEYAAVNMAGRDSDLHDMQNLVLDMSDAHGEGFYNLFHCHLRSMDTLPSYHRI
jgi:hypothetical protein